MATKVQKMQEQALDLWHKSLAQLEVISKSLMSNYGLDKLKFDRAKLLTERDRLLQRLGEETYKLIDQHKIQAPQKIQDIYLRIRDLMDRMIIPQKSAKKKASKRKPARKTSPRRLASSSKRATPSG